MQISLESIICPNCDKALRPPFWVCQALHFVCSYCHGHQSSSTGELECASECYEKAVSLKLLDKMIKNMVDVCQYNCGFYGKLLEIQKHELVCKKNEKMVECAIPNCYWYNLISKLVNHVAESHSNCLVDFQDGLEDGIPISFKRSVKLVSQFTKKQLYWLRVDKFNKNKYIMMLYQGRSDNTAEEAGKMIKYSIKLPKSEDVVFSEVIQTGNDEYIGDDAFLINKGTNITSLPSNKFIVHLTNPTEVISSAVPPNICDIDSPKNCLKYNRNKTEIFKTVLKRTGAGNARAISTYSHNHLFTFRFNSIWILFSFVFLIYFGIRVIYFINDFLFDESQMEYYYL